jgi:hypothetical protein
MENDVDPFGRMRHRVGIEQIANRFSDTFWGASWLAYEGTDSPATFRERAHEQATQRTSRPGYQHDRTATSGS